MRKSLINRFLHFGQFLAITLLAALIALPVHTALAASTVVITEEDIVRQTENTPPTNEWVLYTRTPASLGTFRIGPAAPPAGVGSLELGTPTGADKVYLFNYEHIGTPLDTIDAISYSTYRTAGSASQVTALNIQVDVNGDAPGGFTTLVFEPVYNTYQGAVVSGTWQDWDAYDGGNAIWWSSNPIPSAPNRDTFVSWKTIVDANPDAVILGGFGVNQGSGNPDLTSAVDAITIGYGENTVTYDFELYEVATTKEQCKDGGWESVYRADGTAFKNQGDCIQYVNTGK